MVPDPFSGETHIVRDFCENQVEINTPVVHSCQEAVDALDAGVSQKQLILDYASLD